jgi:antiphage defense system Thoeris ThsB-like protein
MPKIYNLFISHSWSYGNDYQNLCALLGGASGFQYRNYSVPRDDPVHDAPNVQELYGAIWQQMTFCHVVIILAGKYATFSKWIDREIQCAKADLEKPVLG